jgi:hypothetical protein
METFNLLWECTNERRHYFLNSTELQHVTVSLPCYIMQAVNTSLNRSRNKQSLRSQLYVIHVTLDDTILISYLSH